MISRVNSLESGGRPMVPLLGAQRARKEMTASTSVADEEVTGRNTGSHWAVHSTFLQSLRYSRTSASVGSSGSIISDARDRELSASTSSSLATVPRLPPAEALFWMHPKAQEGGGKTLWRVRDSLGGPGRPPCIRFDARAQKLTCATGTSSASPNVAGQYRDIWDIDLQ